MNRISDIRNKGKKQSKYASRAKNLANIRWKNAKTIVECVQQENVLGLVGDNEDQVSKEPNNKQSASEIKLIKYGNFQENSNISAPQYSEDYTLVHVSLWSELYKGVKCGECGMDSVKAELTEPSGFAFKVIVKCYNCSTVLNEIYTSPKVGNTESTRPPFDVNRRMVNTFVTMGKGHSAMEQHCMAMGMAGLSSPSFNSHLIKLTEENKLVRQHVLRNAHSAVRRAHMEVDSSVSDSDVINIGVSYDGTWMKRGHTSKYGLGLVIDILTGLVLDFEIMSKYCSICEKTERKMDVASDEYKQWYQSHKDAGVCEKNFDGSSNAMEMKAAEILWTRSIRLCNMRYTTLLSDGDAKTHHHLQQLQVYGEGIDIRKEECVNHVAKRVGKGLQNIVREWRGTDSSIGGKKKGSLTAEMIPRLQNYYRKAIIDNIPDVNKMKKAIYATLDHAMSTDDKPLHSRCPGGEKSWCFFNRAIAKQEAVPKHDSKTMKTVLRPDVVAKIMPVYCRLASDELLSKCTAGKTQNVNESVHSVIWRKCPKEIFVSKKKLEMAVTSAVTEFNMGCTANISMRDLVSTVKLSPAAYKIGNRRDKRRLQQAATSTSENFKTSRKKLRLSKSVTESRKKQQEGSTYQAGGF